MFKNFTTYLLVVLGMLASAQAKEVLQTQYSKDGVEVDLLRAKVSGNVLSVVLDFRIVSPHGRIEIKYPLDEVHYIDNVESKKYHVLKDEKGEWLSGPKESTKVYDANKNTNVAKKATKVYFDKNKSVDKITSRIVWYKFPAPPENVELIQINIPEVSPFEDVELKGNVPKKASKPITSQNDETSDDAANASTTETEAQ